DTRWNLERLQSTTQNFRHHDLDIRDRAGMCRFVEDVQPDMMIHCAAQPSHDLAAGRPYDDFDVNAVGTLNLLEATRQHAPDCAFAFMSTNKVYGDSPNNLNLVELKTRWDYADKSYVDGINESMSIDQCKHSLFGAGKVAADVLVQEYGKYFGMKTACFRGGCLTGAAHSAVELHGFLAYLIKCVRDERPYTVFGHQAKQVRDNIHSFDVCRVFEEFYLNPKVGEVYNLGGGRGNSVSMLEAIARAEEVTGKNLSWEYNEESRKGDHICYISDLSKLTRDFPDWGITRSLDSIFDEIAQATLMVGQV
ncbi:NAD-dependent epimerase, partial [bacterium M21]